MNCRFVIKISQIMWKWKFCGVFFLICKEIRNTSITLQISVSLTSLLSCSIMNGFHTLSGPGNKQNKPHTVSLQEYVSFTTRLCRIQGFWDENQYVLRPKTGTFSRGFIIIDITKQHEQGSSLTAALPFMNAVFMCPLNCTLWITCDADSSHTQKKILSLFTHHNVVVWVSFFC